jgi:putative transposase
VEPLNCLGERGSSMGRANFARDVEIHRNGRPHKLKLQIDNGWQIEDVRTGRIDFISQDAMLGEYVSGLIQFPIDIEQVRKVKKGMKEFVEATLDNLTAPQKAVVLERRTFLESYLKKYGENFSLRDIVDGLKCLWSGEVAGPAPHPDSVKRWLKKYINAGRNALVLAPASHRKGNREKRIATDVEDFCQQAIREIYLTRTRGTIRETYERALHLLNTENKLRPKEHKLQLPKVSYITSLVQKIPEIDRYTARFGQLAAMHRFRTSIGHAAADRPLMRVEVDHTRLDIVVVDEDTGLPIGRPWLTLIVDVYTKCILGFHLSFDPPSHATVAKALKMSLLPKTWLHEEFSEVNGDWIMFGVMEELVCDNGLEFHGLSLESACLLLGIIISFCPRKTPWWKGTVERTLGTMNRGVTAGMPGKTFSSIKEKGDQNPIKDAAVTLRTLKACMLKWIVDYYHQKPHAALGMTPHEMWQRHASPETISLPADPNQLDAVTGQVETRRVWHYGIELNSLLYNSEELSLIRQKHGDPCEVDIRWDSEDLGSISVAMPDGGFLKVPVIPKMASYASGLTLYQHKVHKRYLAGKGADAYDTAKLVEAREEIRQLIETDKAKAKKKTRTRQHQMQKNQSAPEKASAVVTDNSKYVPPFGNTSIQRPKFQALKKPNTAIDAQGGDHE